MHIIGPDDMPEEFKSAIEGLVQQALNEHSQVEMQGDVTAHRAVAFFKSIEEPEDLKVLRELFYLVGGHGNPRAQYYAGIIAGLLDQKFDICLACGDNHDEKIKEISDEEAKLAEYNMELVPGEYPKVKCKNCGMPYASLADRMETAPEDCMGCQQTAKWG